MNKSNWIDIIIWGILISCTVASIQIYYNISNDSCTSDPFYYGAKNLEEQFGFPFIGTGTFLMNGVSPIISFSSYNKTHTRKDISLDINFNIEE